MPTLDEIAGSMVSNPVKPGDDASDAQSADDTLLDDQFADVDADDQDYDLETEADDEDDSPTMGEDDDQEQEAGEGGEDAETEVIELDDDFQVEVMVDGELQLKTLSDLKKLASGEGAIEKRLKDATETLKAAREEHTLARHSAQKQQTIIATALQHVDQMLFNHKLQEPDPALKQSNPNAYLLKMEEYRAAKQRLDDGRNQLMQLIHGVQQQLDEELAQFRDQESKKLKQALPILNDGERGPARRELMIDAALNAYNFTSQELGLVSDHRLFLMLHDAAMWRAQQDGKLPKATPKKKVSITPSKVIRAGNSKAAERAVKRQQSQQQRARDRAKKTGKVDDVVATMLVNKSARRK